MNRLEFLQAILPANGRYCVMGIDKKRKFEKTKTFLIDDLDQLNKTSSILVNEKYNVYYGTAGYGVSDSRDAANVVSKRELYLDVDCGEDKPYADVQAGGHALKEFCVKIGLPKPCIVFSGNGLQAHWVFEEEVARHIWQPVADKLKQLCFDSNFEVDTGCTADVARVLRMPETINLRGGSLVKVLNSITYYTFDSLRNIIG